MRLRLVGIACLGLIPASCSPQGDDEVDRIIQSQMNERRIPGLSLAVLRDGKILKLKGYGVASLESKAPATEDTVYRLASTTKPFTATGVMKLVDEGKIKLDDRIGDLLPDLPTAWRAVTVHQLLSHTSGLPDIHAEAASFTTLANTRGETLEKAYELPLDGAPGERWKYIQTGYVLLGMVIEKESGEDFAAAMDRWFFRPLGMKSTGFGDPTTVLPGHAMPYASVKLEKGGNQIPMDSPKPLDGRFPDFLAPCATLHSSVRDLAQWEAALASARLLGSFTLEQMWKPTRASECLDRSNDVRNAYGCGWYLWNQVGHRRASHAGGGSAVYMRYVDERLTIIILTNCMGSQPQQFVDDIARVYGVAR